MGELDDKNNILTSSCFIRRKKKEYQENEKVYPKILQVFEEELFARGHEYSFLQVLVSINNNDRTMKKHSNLKYFRGRRHRLISNFTIPSMLSSSLSVFFFFILLFNYEQQHAFAFTQRPSFRHHCRHQNYLFSPYSISINKNKQHQQQTCVTSPLHMSPGDMINHFQLPFSEISRQLSEGLDIGVALNDVGNVPEAATSMVLDSIGRDLLVFLSASVIVTPFCAFLGITPILGYLIAGALLGPHGIDMFSNSKADVELGDFGILFLLFSEGLEVSTARFRKLTDYLPLGIAQITLTAGVLTGGILLGAPLLEKFVPLDKGLIDVSSPVEALVLALAGTLSTSAFVFPVLKDQGWEEEDSGQAATSILLLQDLLVAPLLVLMPFLIGTGNTEFGAIGFLTAKATVGFGLVIFAGSRGLSKVFELVAQAKSTETFVALCLLVSVGMGVIAKSLGLTDTVGAFAAGVLLANTNYRAQIQADISPFKGILLGIFFMDAGTSFDTDLVLAEIPTILTGVFSLILLKASTMLVATRVPRWMEPNRLTIGEGIKVALLLAGGGEFAFVVLALAEKLGVLPPDLGGLLTAIVLITMAVTPLLGQFAEKVSEIYAGKNSGVITTTISTSTQEETIPSEIASNAIVICGHGEVGQSTLQVLGEEYGKMKLESLALMSSKPKIVAFDTDPALVNSCVLMPDEATVLFGDAANPEVLKNSGISNPSAIFVSYEDHGKVVSTVSRLRGAFPTVPIYANSQTRSEAGSLKDVGVSEVIVEQDEIPKSEVALIMRKQQYRSAVEALREISTLSTKTGTTAEEIRLLQIYNAISLNDASLNGATLKVSNGGVVDADRLAKVLRKSNRGIHSDEEINRMEAWIRAAIPGVDGRRPINEEEFCQLYRCSPPFVQETLSGVRK